MKILYMVPEGGASRLSAMSFIDEELHALHARGVEAHVLDIEAGQDSVVGGIRKRSVRRLAERLEIVRLAGDWLRSLPWRSARRDVPLLLYVLRAEAAAASLARNEGFDAIHSHFGSFGGLGGSLAARTSGVPLIASLRGMDLRSDPARNYGLRQRPLFDANIRHLLATADRTIYNSEYMRDLGISLGAQSERAHKVVKGVDLGTFKPSRDRKNLLEELQLDGPVVLTVASLLPRKGIDHALRALASLDRKDIQYVVCGEGPERSSLIDLARSLGLSDRVRFMGRVSRDRVASYFAAAEVFVMTSDHEAAGNVYLEAQASGVPCIASDEGGPVDYVANGRTGFTVPYGDIDALTARLRDILCDSLLRERMSHEARRFMEHGFAYGRMVDDFLDIYRNAIAERQGERSRRASAVRDSADMSKAHG
jgi:glycosyltransferase involved in cell wall biosynthesis